MLGTPTTSDPNGHKFDPILIITLLIVGFFLVASIKNCMTKNQGTRETIDMVNAMNDSVRIHTYKDSQIAYNTTVIQAYANATFLKLKVKDSTIAALQAKVKEYESRLGKSGSVTNTSVVTSVTSRHKTKVSYEDDWTTDIHFDTAKAGERNGTGIVANGHYDDKHWLDSVYKVRDAEQREWLDTIGGYKLLKMNESNFMYPIYSDSLVNKWITYHATMSKDSSIFDLKVNNEYSTVIGTEHGKPFVEVTNSNPYSTVKSLRTFQVKSPPPKSFGVGLSSGITLNSSFRPTFYIGVGINYNIIRF